MTINNSPEQSFETIGIDLYTQAFCHSQLYIALSRITSLHRLNTLFAHNATRITVNIFYPKALLTSYR